ncbi:hypothetical protein I7X12_16520 [Halosimplex litoreum]|uniref:Protein-glutamine gamma-glutamyltransferase-like C-terminal domain-containing protein n=1 Tax=Halosimplex litoreum TaxID=1198301 RepID=A0A7T3FX98_9EURY|nr:DUF4129 domain-containing protein [Halosimplex litoreum]QPV62326.1 hypothetical protein I7X12_16520 [Halosimplex litoreum]
MLDVQRLGTALVALLALVALAGAAGTFGAVEGPALSGGGTPTGPATPTEVPPPTGAPGGAADSEVRRADTPTTAAADDSGGVSPFVVPAVGGSLLAVGLLVVFLTGHDDRAPAAPEEGSEGEGPTPAVSPSYDSHDENAVTRAWRRLHDRSDAEETATPGDVAARALDRGLPGDAVATITDRFRVVRYGGESAEGDRGEPAVEAAATIDSGDETDGPPAESDAADAEPADCDSTDGR